MLWSQRVLMARDVVRSALAAFLAALALVGPVLAHGGGIPQLVDVPAGPYQVFAWTNPDPVRVGTMHVTVALVEPSNDAAVLGADVQVLVEPLNAGPEAQPVLVQATHEKAAIKTYYETDLSIPATGLWRTTITFDNAGNSGSAAFEIEVEPRSTTNWLLIGGGALVLAGLGWFLWPRKR